MEKKYGDIGLILDIRFSDGSRHLGVGILEAKKRYINGGKFEGFRFEQARDINNNAPFSFFLLYDYQPANQSWRDVDLSFRESVIGGQVAWHTQAIVVPSSIVVAKKRLDVDLYKFALPLSYQLCFRYFRGFDLHYADTLQEALEYARTQQVEYLLAVTVAHGDEQSEAVIDVGEDFESIECDVADGVFDEHWPE